MQTHVVVNQATKYKYFDKDSGGHRIGKKQKAISLTFSITAIGWRPHIVFLVLWRYSAKVLASPFSNGMEQHQFIEGIHNVATIFSEWNQYSALTDSIASIPSLSSICMNCHIEPWTRLSTQLWDHSNHDVICTDFPTQRKEWRMWMHGRPVPTTTLQLYHNCTPCSHHIECIWTFYPSGKNLMIWQIYLLDHQDTCSGFLHTLPHCINHIRYKMMSTCAQVKSQMHGHNARCQASLPLCR